MRIHLIDLEQGNIMKADNTSPDFQTGVQLADREFKAIIKFYDEAKPIFGPYIQAHQRV